MATGARDRLPAPRVEATADPVLDPGNPVFLRSPEHPSRPPVESLVRSGRYARSQEEQVQAEGSMAEASEFHAACAVLGLSQAPSMSEAKSAFRVRAALLHPDVHQSGGAHRMEAATDAMQQLNDAYQLVLTSLEAGDTKPVIRGQRAVVRRCSRCRYRFQDRANRQWSCARAVANATAERRVALVVLPSKSALGSRDRLRQASNDAATHGAHRTSRPPYALARRG